MIDFPYFLVSDLIFNPLFAVLYQKKSILAEIKLIFLVSADFYSKLVFRYFPF